jgi:hypothetical protein
MYMGRRNFFSNTQKILVCAQKGHKSEKLLGSVVLGYIKPYSIIFNLA